MTFRNDFKDNRCTFRNDLLACYIFLDNSFVPCSITSFVNVIYIVFNMSHLISHYCAAINSSTCIIYLIKHFSDKDMRSQIVILVAEHRINDKIRK